MSSFYDDMRSLAQDVLSGELGQSDIVYVAVTAGDGPDDEPGPSTETNHDVKGVSRGVSGKFIDGTSVVASDLQVFVANDNEFIPQMTGYVLLGNIRYKIVSIMPTNASDTIIGWTLIIRK